MSEFFIRRPIVAMVISIIMILMGGMTLQNIPVSQYPEIVPPMIKVTTTYVGANAVNVEEAVSTPIEQQVNGVENMLYMKSINANDGSLQLQVSFEVGSQLDFANMLTQNRVTQATSKLPIEVKNVGVVTQKSLVFPMIVISLSSPNDTFDTEFLCNYANINIVDQIARLNGVGSISLFGGADYSMRIWVNPDKLVKYGLTVNDLINSVRQQNTIVPGGKFGAPPTPSTVENTYTIRLQSRLISEEEFGNIIIKADENGAIVRLSDVAQINLGTENYNAFSRYNGGQAASIGVYQLPGSNALDVAANIRKVMDDQAGRFPEDLVYKVSLDTTAAVNEGISEIVQTLFEAVVLVILVVFLFLQNWKATLIPLLTVPVSLISTFIVFPMLGFSVNVLSLLGLVLAIGVVVDDAIVVVEAVIHNIEQGLSPKEATRKAMMEVGGPVIAMTMILFAVFVPVAFAGGITGRLYQQFALTIAISVGFSAFNALTLSPALSAMLLKPVHLGNGPLDRFFKGFNYYFDKFTNSYIGVVKALIARPSITIFSMVAIIVATVFLGRSVPSGFVPEEDQGYYMMALQLPDAASLNRTDETARQVEKLLSSIEEVESYTVIMGFSMLTSSYASNTAFVFVALKPWHERKYTAAQIIKKTNMLAVSNITDATVLAFGPPPIIGLGTGAGFTMMLQDRGGNTPGYLSNQAQLFIAEAQKRPEIDRIYTLYRSDVPQKKITVDVEKTAKLGIDLSSLNSVISTYLGSAYINDFNQFGRQYKVYIQAEENYRLSAKNLQDYYVKSAKGDVIPVNTLVTVTDTVGPEFTNRFNMYRAAEITGTPAPGYSSSQAHQALMEVADQVLPSDMGYAWANMSYQEIAAEGKGAIMFITALVFVFLLLAAQYESWSLPFSVLLGTPLVVFGAFLGLWFCGLFSSSYVNNVFAQIGLVLLIGLSAKNAILIVEFAKEAVAKKGMNVQDAAIEAARLRLRPILMTAFSFILGVVPLLTATGAGAEARKVMGMAVFAGLLVASIFGILFVPVFFVLVEKMSGGKRESAE